MRNISVSVGLAMIVLVFAFSMPAHAQYYDFFQQRVIDPWKSLLGKPAPDVRLAMLDGGTFELAAYKGEKIVVMDFWATWCPPCRILMPAFAEIADEYKGKDVVFYTVNQREPTDLIEKYLENAGLDLKVALDERGRASALYKVDSIPRLIIVDKDGTVQAVHAAMQGSTPERMRANSKRRLAQELDKLLEGEKLVAPDEE